MTTPTTAQAGLPELPPLMWHNHPDFPSVKWTDMEIDAIKKYASAAVRAAQAAQPGRKPLSDDELFRLLHSIDSITRRLPPGFKEFARAIERAHGIGEPK